MYNHGFLKVASAVPVVTLGDPFSNVRQIIRMLSLMEERKIGVALLPELAITGYSAGDLFFQKYLLDESDKAISFLLSNNPFSGVVILGTVFNYEEVLYNCAFVIQKDRIIGIVPKIFLPQTKEFYESRWFASGEEIVKKVSHVEYLGQTIPFGNLVFEDLTKKVRFGTEVCADIWAPVSPHTELYANDCQIVFNPSASDDYIGKADIRRMLIASTSYKWNGAYVYVSTGASESSSEVVFSGHKIIAESGKIIADDDELSLNNEFVVADIDVDRLKNERRNNGWFKLAKDIIRKNSKNRFQKVTFHLPFEGRFIFETKMNRFPLAPHDPKLLQKAIDLSAVALVKRLMHAKTDKVVIGVSGGLDSTLALLTAVNAMKKMSLPRGNILAVTMPAAQTSTKTLANARELMRILKVSNKEIPVEEEVIASLAKIGHNGSDKNITFENAYARYRTMVLMNLANESKAIVVGTSDMSEIALGWSTFNGDHMAMYGVNGGITKTLVIALLRHYATNHPELKDVLKSILATPISPELSAMDQKTEDVIGKYEVNDFILYRFIQGGDTPERIAFLLEETFNLGESESKLYVRRFIKRFFQNQFKRLTSPESVKILPISLSPRTELRLVGDVNYLEEPSVKTK